MATTIKTKGKKPRTIHKCSQAEIIERQGILIERIGKITLGNGTPEDGLLFKFRRFLDYHDKVVSDIKEIKTKLSTMSEIDFEIEVSRRVNIELEKQKEKMKQDSLQVKDMNIKKSSFSWQKISGFVAIVSIIIITIFSILNYSINKDSKSKSPVQTETTKK